MSYCTAEDVLKITKTKPKHFGFNGEDAEDKLEELINDWIHQSESHINAYCRRNWYDYYEDDEKIIVKVPSAVKNVCIRLTANIIAFSYARKDTPIKEVNDFAIKIFSSEIFTEDLKEDLKPFRKPRKAKVFRI